MKWNWQQKDWPFFTYEQACLEDFEAKFLYQSGFLKGLYSHIQGEEKNTLTVDLMSDEALKTSEIEGEYLDRTSLRSSICRCFGLKTDKRRILPAEQGIAEMIVDLHHSFAAPLTHDMLCSWHLMLVSARRDLDRVGAYRTHSEAMQVVSGQGRHRKVHFEAPPSKEVMYEMDRFVKWFNASAPYCKSPLSALTRAGIAHLYFVSIHPFEDGNGRIGRAIAIKALSQSLGYPAFILLSHIIQKHKKTYYNALEKTNKSNELSEWLIYFSKTILDAQDYTLKMVNFTINKAKLYGSVKGQLNARQEKVIHRLFQEGLEGFKGGLSAENYIRITGTSRATATRDLQDLVDLNVLRRTGERKSTRYYLDLK